MATTDTTRVAYIYTLVDDRIADPVDSVRYVGRTVTSLTRRMKEHMRTAMQGDRTYRGTWMRSVLSAGGSISIVPVAVVTWDECSEAEQAWIRLYKSIGARLTNATDGGPGLLNPSPETRSRIGASKRGNKYWVGRKHSSESRAKMSARQIGRPMHPHTRAALFTREVGAKIAATLRSRVLTPEELEAKRRCVHMHLLSSASKDKMRSAVKQPEHRAALSQAARRPERMAHITALGKSSKGRTASPEVRARMSIRQRGRLHSDETKAKMSAWQQGGDSHRAKLTWPQVRTIRQRYTLGGISQRQLAREYQVQPRTINLIVHGATWPEVSPRGDSRD